MPRLKGSTTKQLTEAEKKIAAEKRAQEKRERFIKLAFARLIKAEKAIGSLLNLANRNSYSFTADDNQVIQDRLDAAVEAVDNAFKASLAGKPAKEIESAENPFK